MTLLDNLLPKLRMAKSALETKYHIKSLALFGSIARSEDSPESDVDLLVDFTEPIGIEFVYLANDLEKLLHRKVDLVSRGGIKEYYFKEIEKDLIYLENNI